MKSVQWKKKLKIVYIEKNKDSKIGYSLLATNNLEATAFQITEYYCLRFQIEFLFRDAKQHLGLENCQSTDKKTLDFHFKTTMLALNLAKSESYSNNKKTFSLYDIKTHYFNETTIERIFTNFGLDLNFIKLHHKYEETIRNGMINP